MSNQQSLKPIVLDLLFGTDASSAQLPNPNDRRSKLLVPYLSKCLNYIHIPQFNMENISWLGASSIQLKFNYHLPTSFTLPVKFVVPENTSFCPVIRYDVGGIPIRYKLWNNVGELLYVELYDGQLIYKDFYIEIWNVKDVNILNNESPIILPTSRLKKPNLSLGRYLCNEFDSTGNDESGNILVTLDNQMNLTIWNPSTQKWIFAIDGSGTLVNL